MRIVSGKWRSKRITAPKNLPTRPTTDFAKESLFNVLNNRFDFEEIRVLDLFSGTGNISYEFASRGTVDLTAVDQNRNWAQRFARPSFQAWHEMERYQEFYACNQRMISLMRRRNTNN